MKRLLIVVALAGTLCGCIPELVKPAHASFLWYMVGQMQQQTLDQAQINDTQAQLNACRAELAKLPPFKMDRQQ